MLDMNSGYLVIFFFIIGSTKFNKFRLLRISDFAHTTVTQDNGKRTTYAKLLKPSKNLKILFNTIVSRILFDASDPKQAIGVEVYNQNQFYKIYAKEGINLSAGTVGSSKILMLSGVGPKEQLVNLKIPVVEDLPVGEKLQDHVTTGFSLILLNQSLGMEPINILSPRSIFNYFTSAESGNHISFGGADAMGFVSLKPLESEVPDLSFIVIPVGLSSDYGLHLKNILNIKEDLWTDYFKPTIGMHSATILPVLLNPKSRGCIRLKSNNFLDPPLIDPKYLEHPEDLLKLKSGINILKRLLDTSSLSELGTEINPKPLPGCENYKFDSDSYWECYLRHMTFTMYHPVGTNKMGYAEDPTTVVLQNFQVKNLKNLYVIDGSVIPNAPSANPNAIIALYAKKYLEQIV